MVEIKRLQEMFQSYIYVSMTMSVEPKQIVAKLLHMII